MAQNKETDPLQGFRGRDNDFDLSESMAESAQALADMGVDYRHIADVIVSNDLQDALNEDTLMARLAGFCALKIKENTYTWSTSNDPCDKSMLKAHLETRAARLVISWIEQIVETGKIAEQIIERQEHSEI